MKRKSSKSAQGSSQVTFSSTSTTAGGVQYVSIADNRIDPDKVKKGLQELERQRNNAKNDSDSYKLGRILTVIDGVISDPEQRKAVKDLVQNIWYDNNSPISPFAMNNSLEALLAKALGFKLWDEPDLSQPQTPVEWNPFDEVVNK